MKTGEVARVLGVSRQHVVDLCDRGDLVSVRIGAHRRVPESEVDRLVGRQLTEEQERSLWLHRALLMVLLAEPEPALSRARDNLERWRELHRPDGMTSSYFDRWDAILDCGLDAVVRVISSESEEACELRQNSPFAGLLPDETRAKVLRSFRDHWSREHDAGRGNSVPTYRKTAP